MLIAAEAAENALRFPAGEERHMAAHDREVARPRLGDRPPAAGTPAPVYGAKTTTFGIGCAKSFWTPPGL